MTENTIPVEDETKDEARTTTDRISVAGGDLIKTVQSLLREAAVRRIVIQDKTGRTLLEMPLYAGVFGAFIIGSWTVLALIAAWFAEVSILIERDVQSDGEPSVVGEAVAATAGRAAGGVSATAKSAASSAASVVGSAAGAAARGAGNLARRAADSLEGRMGQGDKADEYMAQGWEAADAILKASGASPAPQQCAAITKAGTRCKRTAVAGSEYCSTHQPAG
jgi:hypothetical protein